jgi:hypothetical protein
VREVGPRYRPDEEDGKEEPHRREREDENVEVARDYGSAQDILETGDGFLEDDGGGSPGETNEYAG